LRANGLTIALYFRGKKIPSAWSAWSAVKGIEDCGGSQIRSSKSEIRSVFAALRRDKGKTEIGNPKLENQAGPIRGQKGISDGRSAGFQTCCIADFQIGSMW